MPIMNLTPEEIRFLDQYVRELHLGAGVATAQLHERGIFYDTTLFRYIIYLWDQDWKTRDMESSYPNQDATEVTCPWSSRKELEERVKEINPIDTGETLK